MDAPDDDVAAEEVTVEIASWDRNGIALKRLCPYCGRFYDTASPEFLTAPVTTTGGAVLADRHQLRCAAGRGLVPGKPAQGLPVEGVDRTRTSYNRKRICCVCKRKYTWCHALKRKRPITLPDGRELDDFHRLKCAKVAGLITDAEYRASARPPPGYHGAKTPEAKRRIEENRKRWWDRRLEACRRYGKMNAAERAEYRRQRDGGAK